MRKRLKLLSQILKLQEAITGDIITPTKRSIPGFVEILEKVELQMMEDYMFEYVPEDYKNYISPYIFAPFDDDL
jgi:putative hydrolase of HD superfamily